MKSIVKPWLLFLSILAVHVDAQAVDELINYEQTVHGAKLPPGFSVSRTETKDGDKLLATRVVFAKDGTITKAIVTVENRELPTDGHRTAALKGYVNGTAKSFAEVGLKLVDKELPDLNSLDFSKPIVTKFTFKNDEKVIYLVEVQSLLGNVGQNIVLLTGANDELKILSDWAKTVKPLIK